MNNEIFKPVVLSFTDGPMVEKLINAGIKAHVAHTERPFDKEVRGEVCELLIRNSSTKFMPMGHVHFKIHISMQ